MDININDLEKKICDNKEIIEVMRTLRYIAIKTNNQNFINFIDKELNGYDKNDSVPSYRILSNNTINCYIGNNFGHSQYGVSTGQIPEKYRENLEKVIIKDPINSIIKKMEKDSVEISVDPNYKILINKIMNLEAQGVEVKEATLKFYSGSFSKIIESIIMKMQEFLHELSKIVPEHFTASDINKNFVTIQNVFNQVFNSYMIENNGSNYGIIGHTVTGAINGNGNNNMQSNNNSGTVNQSYDSSSNDIHENDLNTIIKALQVLQSITTKNQEELEIKKQTIKKMSSIIADGSKSKLMLIKDEILPTLSNVVTVFGPIISILMGINL